MDGPPRRRGDAAEENWIGQRTPLPPWARPWVSIVQVVGLPTVVVFFYLGQEAGYVPSRTDKLIQVMVQHEAMSAERHKGTEERANTRLVIDKQMSDGLRRSNRIMAAMCTEAYKDPAVRRACLTDDP